MKLEPKAKPVRIRIKIGDTEISNLAELKKKFSLKDILPLYEDGRLDRWLRQIGENVLADNLSKPESNGKNGNPSTEDVMHRDVILLSNFFHEVNESLDKYGRDTEWHIDKFLCSASEECIKIIFKKAKECNGIKWSDHIGRLLTLDNVFSYYEDTILNTIFPSPIEWGHKFAELAKNDESYRNIFEYLLKEYLLKESHIEEPFNIFLSTAKPEWKQVYTKELQTIDFVERAYLNKSLRNTCDNWGKMFAEAASKKNWEPDGPRIEKILGEDKEQLMSFYENTEHKEAREKIDPWYRLANSDKDYENVKKALDDYKNMKRELKDKKQYNYYKLEIPLSKRIIDFLVVCNDIDLEIPSNKKTELNDEYKLLTAVKKLRLRHQTKQVTSDLSKIKKNEMESPTTRSIAKYILNFQKGNNSLYINQEKYKEITKFMVKKIAERLKNLREK